MKKLFLSVFAFLALAGYARAGVNDTNNIVYTSYTEISMASPVLFTSAAVQFVGITISSPAPGSFVAFYRSTSATFTPDITTQTLHSTGMNSSTQDGVTIIPMYDMTNSSYTYWYKSGNAKLVLWMKYPPMGKGRLGLPQGLSGSGNSTNKLRFE